MLISVDTPVYIEVKLRLKLDEKNKFVYKRLLLFTHEFS